MPAWSSMAFWLLGTTLLLYGAAVAAYMAHGTWAWPIAALNAPLLGGLVGMTRWGPASLVVGATASFVAFELVNVLRTI